MSWTTLLDIVTINLLILNSVHERINFVLDSLLGFKMQVIVRNLFILFQTSRLARCVSNFILWPLQLYSKDDSWKKCSWSTNSFPVIILYSYIFLYSSIFFAPEQLDPNVPVYPNIKVMESMYYLGHRNFHLFLTVHLFSSEVTMSEYIYREYYIQAWSLHLKNNY